MSQKGLLNYSPGPDEPKRTRGEGGDLTRTPPLAEELFDCGELFELWGIDPHNSLLHSFTVRDWHSPMVSIHWWSSTNNLDLPQGAAQLGPTIPTNPADNFTSKQIIHLLDVLPLLNSLYELLFPSIRSISPQYNNQKACQKAMLLPTERTRYGRKENAHFIVNLTTYLLLYCIPKSHLPIHKNIHILSNTYHSQGMSRIIIIRSFHCWGAVSNAFLQ